MGEEVYGLWNTVTAFFAMFAFADLGLGNGLLTELSKVSALDDKQQCRKMVSSCYVMLTAVALCLILIFVAVYPFVNWAGLVNAKSAQTMVLAGGVCMALVSTKIINVPLALIQRTQLAMQEGYRSNMWACSGNLLSLLSVIVTYYYDLGVLTMIWASSAIPVVVSALNMYVYFKWQRPELAPSLSLFDWSICRKLLNMGLMFFVLSIFTSISLSIDNFIVAHVCSLSDVTPFSITFKIVTIIGVVSHMLASPMWSANGEAMQRGEHSWVKRATRKITLMSFLFALSCSIGMFLLLKTALWLLTNGVVQPDYMLLLGMSLLQILIAITSPYFMVLNGAGIVKFQIFNYIVYAAISLPLKYYLGLDYGMHAVVWVGVVSYLVLLTFPTAYRSLKHLNCKLRKEQF